MQSAGALSGLQRFSRAFSWRVGWRLVLLAVALALAVLAANPPTLPASTVLALAVAALLGHALWKEVRRTNQALARLLQALLHQDHSARFDGGAADAGFAELADGFRSLLQAQGEQAMAQSSRLAQLQAALEHAPTPLLAVDAQERVSLLNLAARRLLGPRDGLRVADFAALGPDLPAALRASGAAEEAAWCSVEMRPAKDAALLLRVARSHALYDGRPQTLVSLQPIQAELDSAEARLSAGLVRVLTHEVMNSLTPVNSLLRSAVDAAARLPTNADTAPLQAALQTAARRSEGLMQFAQRYRTLAQPLQVHKAAVDSSELARSLALLFRAEWPASELPLELVLAAAPPSLQADRDVLEPVLLNLLRNAAQAALLREDRAAQRQPPQVRLSIYTSSRGRVVLDIEDSGPGIPPALREEVFLPFFTTKREGHGIGLALARQAVLAHGGAIRVEDSAALGGACVRIVL